MAWRGGASPVRRSGLTLTGSKGCPSPDRGCAPMPALLAAPKVSSCQPPSRPVRHAPTQTETSGYNPERSARRRTVMSQRIIQPRAPHAGYVSPVRLLVARHPVATFLIGDRRGTLPAGWVNETIIAL